MIKKFIERFESRKEEIASKFKSKHPENYDEIVSAVVDALADDDWAGRQQGMAGCDLVCSSARCLVFALALGV